MPVMDFDTYPLIDELLYRGGTPGITYAYVLGQNIGQAQEEGWEMLHRVPAFTVQGHSMVLMGLGEPIRGASVESWCPEVLVDKEADKLIGRPDKEAEKVVGGKQEK